MSETKTCTCISCPLGCEVTVELEHVDDEIKITSVTGYTCIRGKHYAVQEVTDPVRMVTATISIPDRLLPASVKTSKPVPKNRMKDVLDCIANCALEAPVYVGDIAISHVAGTDADVVITKTVL